MKEIEEKKKKEKIVYKSWFYQKYHYSYLYYKYNWSFQIFKTINECLYLVYKSIFSLSHLIFITKFYERLKI